MRSCLLVCDRAMGLLASWMVIAAATVLLALHGAAPALAESSNKGLGPRVAVPSWAAGEHVHFMAGEPASSSLTGGPLEQGVSGQGPGGSSELGRRPGTDKPLLYHGGSGVQHSPTVYLIFWGKNWEAEPGTALKTQLVKMYGGLSGSTWQGMLTQYFDSTGRVSSTVTVATPWIDKSVTAPTSVNNTKIKNEVAEALKAEVNKTWKREFSSQFVVMPAPGSTYEAGFDTGFCAYHGVDSSGSSFTFLPYLGEEPFKAGCVKFYEPKHENADNVDSMAATHEYAESATDPQVEPFANATWYTKNGWEIGDMCASEGAAEEVTSGSLKGSWVQGQWDDHQSACSLEDEKPPHVYAVTETATGLKTHEATLKGTVNPEGLETKYHFEYGTTTSYGSSTAEVSAGSSTSNQTASQLVSGLLENTTYHFRLVAKNSTGTTDGEDAQFTTPAISFSVQTTPNPSGALASELSSVSCSSSTNCEAVGRYENSSSVWVTLAEGWNGTEWKVQSTPNPTGATESSLRAVSCTSSTSCIAVGTYKNSETQLALAESWNGTEWSLKSVPGISGSEAAYLNGVSCSSSTSCIAVGRYIYERTSASGFSDSWNGTEWKEISKPTLNYPFAVSCLSATACYAAGATIKAGVPFDAIAVWNGEKWSSQESHTEPHTSFYGVACSSTSSCMAVGRGNGTEETLAEHWNGTEWVVQSTPKLIETPWLSSASCTSATSCMTVGGYELESHGLVAESWNETKWLTRSVQVPSGSSYEILEGVACTATTTCTAVGNYKNSSGVRVTLAEAYS